MSNCYRICKYVNVANNYFHDISYVSRFPPFQEIDPHRREVGNHVEFDSEEWKYVEKTLISFDAIATIIHKWCAKSKGLLIETTRYE